MDHNWRFDRTAQFDGYEHYKCLNCGEKYTGSDSRYLTWAGCKPEPVDRRIYLHILYYQDERSDKEYHVWIESVPNRPGKYAVKFKFGKRGGKLLQGEKVSRGTWEVATETLERVVEQKLKKGYEEE